MTSPLPSHRAHSRDCCVRFCCCYCESGPQRRFLTSAKMRFRWTGSFRSMLESPQNLTRSVNIISSVTPCSLSDLSWLIQLTPSSVCKMLRSFSIFLELRNDMLSRRDMVRNLSSSLSSITSEYDSQLLMPTRSQICCMIVFTGAASLAMIIFTELSFILTRNGRVFLRYSIVDMGRIIL